MEFGADDYAHLGVSLGVEEIGRQYGPRKFLEF